MGMFVVTHDAWMGKYAMMVLSMEETMKVALPRP